MYLAASKVIDLMGGDPESAVAAEAGTYQGLSQLQQQMPMHRMRQRLSAAEETEGALGREAEDIGIMSREVALGRRVTGGRELLEAISQRLGTTPEQLSRKLSPTQVGDYSSLSKAAFGKSAKQMGTQNA
jgi:hypothetical protein